MPKSHTLARFPTVHLSKMGPSSDPQDHLSAGPCGGGKSNHSPCRVKPPIKTLSAFSSQGPATPEFMHAALSRCPSVPLSSPSSHPRRHPHRARPHRHPAHPGRCRLAPKPPPSRAAGPPQRRTRRPHVIHHHNQLDIRYPYGSVEERSRHIGFSRRRRERGLRHRVSTPDWPRNPAGDHLRHAARQNQAVVDATSQPPPPSRRDWHQEHALRWNLVARQFARKLAAQQPSEFIPDRSPRGELQVQDRFPQHAFIRTKSDEVCPGKALVATPRTARHIAVHPKLRFKLRRTRAAARAVICRDIRVPTDILGTLRKRSGRPPEQPLFKDARPCWQCLAYVLTRLDRCRPVRRKARWPDEPGRLVNRLARHLHAA